MGGMSGEVASTHSVPAGWWGKAGGHRESRRPGPGFTREPPSRAVATERRDEARWVRSSFATGIRRQHIKTISAGHGPRGRLRAFMVFKINHERQMEF